LEQPKYLGKFWTENAFREIRIHGLAVFKNLTEIKLRQFCRMCTLKIYNDGGEVNINEAGAVIIKGKIKEVRRPNMRAKQKNFGGVSFIPPTYKDSTFTAQISEANDYVVLMHFMEDWSDTLKKEEITNEIIEQFGRDGFMNNLKNDVILKRIQHKFAELFVRYNKEKDILITGEPEIEKAHLNDKP
jgi:hypothetical protein